MHQQQQKRASLFEEAKRLAGACNCVELRQAGMQALQAIGVVPGCTLCWLLPWSQVEMGQKLDLNYRPLCEGGEVEERLIILT